MDSTLKDRLDFLLRDSLFNIAVVATEPKAHAIYLQYFIKNKVPVLVDKPVIAIKGLSYEQSAPDKQIREIKRLADLSDEYHSPVLVQVQRREHEAYKFAFEEIRKVITEFSVPVTYFHIAHSDGTWSIPDEYLSRENHPYKYGYGKLMHSGYHFVDLVAWIAEMNQIVFESLTIKNRSSFIFPEQHFHMINGARLYKKLFNQDTCVTRNKNMGEVDSFSTFTFYSGSRVDDAKVCTVGSVDLLQSGFSKRAWFDLARDTYKGNGRIRHSTVNIHVGSLMNIQIHSYQSNEVGKSRLFGVGGEEHEDVYIFRNNELIGGKDVEVINFGEEIALRARKEKDGSFIGQNETSRYGIFKKLLEGDYTGVTLQEQLVTNQILSSMYSSAQSGQSDSINI